MNAKNLLILIVLMAISNTALAAAAAGGGLPWEGGLTALVASFTGPVAYAVSVLGLIISIGILIFGNDLNAFGRTIVFIILAASVIVTAANTLQIFTGVGAATTVFTAVTLAAFLMLVGTLTAVQEMYLRVFSKAGLKNMPVVSRA